MITDLKKRPAKFLGFALVLKEHRFGVKRGLRGRLMKNMGFSVQIDTARVFNKLKQKSMIKESSIRKSEGSLDNKHSRTTSVQMMTTFTPYQIVKTFRSRAEGIYQFFAQIVTFKKGLAQYEYIIQRSCIQTLARREGISTKQVLQKYGRNLTTYQEEERMNRDGKKYKVRRMMNFPEPGLLEERCSRRLETNERLKQTSNIRISIARRSQDMNLSDHLRQLLDPNSVYKNSMKKVLELNENMNANMEEIISYKPAVLDPFTSIKLNFRSAYQLRKYCVICGARPTPSNPIETHHVRHIRKGKVSGFTQLINQ